MRVIDTTSVLTHHTSQSRRDLKKIWLQLAALQQELGQEDLGPTLAPVMDEIAVLIHRLGQLSKLAKKN